MPDSQAPQFLPWVTRALVLACVVVFVAMALAGAGVLRPDTMRYIDWGSNLAALTTAGEWWRLASSTFLHFGLLHLAFNMWALWSIGAQVERLFGHGRVAAIYAISGLAGGLASIAWNPLVNSAGASGAIFGLIGALLAFFLRGGHLVPAAVIRAQRNSTLGFIAYSVTFGFVVPGIDNAAHLGGLATGLAMGWLLARPLGAAPRRGRDLAGVLLACLLAAAVLAAGGFAAQRAAAAHAIEQDYLRQWRWYAGREPVVLAEMGRVMSAARDRKLGDADVVRWLEQTGIPFYREAAARLGSQALPAGSPLADGRARALQFVARRAATLELMAAGIRENDRAKLERAVSALGQPPPPM